jgi:glutathione S-transferase
MERLMLNGVPGSPYTRKMLALLRYRRIPYKLVLASHGAPGLPRPKVSLLPTFYFPGPDGALQPVTDSTPILLRLEKDIPDRPVKPQSPALRFLDSILEDYGDEWLTKAMFHYRWAYEADIARAGAILPAWRMSRVSDDVLAAAGREISERQIGRLRYVGSNETTGPVIEESYKRFLDLFEAHLRDHAFLLGARPGAADFAAFGQLTQLALFDPTPMALTMSRAPRVAAWVMAAEDLCGLEPEPGDWFDPAALPATARALIAEAGRVYAPLLLANARALQQGRDTVETEIDGRLWTQQPFPYQAKCLAWLREEYAALPAAERTLADGVLADTGWAAVFAGAAAAA